MRHGGFTLIELVVVMVIIATLGAIAVPRLQGSTRAQRVESAAIRVVNDLNHARTLARTTGAEQRITFTSVGPTASYTLLDAAPLRPGDAAFTVTLSDEPYRVRIDAVDFGGDSTLVYSGYGLPDTGGQVVLSHAGHQATITVDHPSGRASRP